MTATTDSDPQAPLPTAIAQPRAPRRPLGFELALVVLIAAAILVPGIWRYSLVDPWETHYGEVSRAMLQDHDLVHTNWPGTSSGNPGDHEGFRSKPVLMFWMMAAGLQAVGVADDGGYSGEMVASAWTMVGIRLPFVLSAIAGLALMWFALARLVDRRLAWLALLVVGSTPMFCLIARQAIPDMPMVACTIGALATFLLAIEDGDRPVTPLAISVHGRQLRFDARHVVLGIAAGFVIVQAAYYAIYFAVAPQLGIRGRIPNPALWLPLVMLWALAGLHRDGWLLCLWRLPCVLLGGVIAAIVNEPMPARRPGQGLWRHVFDDVVRPWERHAIDRYVVRGVVYPIAWARGHRWADTDAIADRVLGMARITTMRQLYLIACYLLLAISVLAKGPPGFAVVALVGLLHVLCFWRWRALYEGGYELKRGVLLIVVAALPWHIAMWLKEGYRFVQEYWHTHILNRASSGVDNSPGTFEYYTDQLGHGMWLWAALLPAAIAAALWRSNRDTREGRVRFTVTLWAISGVAVFCLVQTKFHHYILPAIPPLALLVAWLLHDLYAGRDRLHPLYAALGVGIVLLMTRDLMFEPERWIEMFVYRYDRPWPNAQPYAIDTSDPFLALGLVAALAIAVAATRFVRLGVALLGGAGLAICVWALQGYMPLAGQHWGMRDAVRTYYEQRMIYGEKQVYFGLGELYDAWHDADDVVRFDTFIPDNLQVGQPMTITIRVVKPEDERIVEHEVAMLGDVTAIGDHTVEVTLRGGERAKLAPLLANGEDGARGRRPIHAVDADRLIAWQLYWRGEQFWSGGEIWAYSPSPVLPEMKTSFVNTNNAEFQKYLADRTRAPYGRRYFLITEASRILTPRAMLPTQHARETYEVLDTTSNKFSLAAFTLLP